MHWNNIQLKHNWTLATGKESDIPGRTQSLFRPGFFSNTIDLWRCIVLGDWLCVYYKMHHSIPALHLLNSCTTYYHHASNMTRKTSPDTDKYRRERKGTIPSWKTLSKRNVFHTFCKTWVWLFNGIPTVRRLWMQPIPYTLQPRVHSGPQNPTPSLAVSPIESWCLLLPFT